MRAALAPTDPEPFALIPAATFVTEDLNVTPAEAILSPCPVEEIDCEAPEATEAENPANLSTEADPFAAHTIVAVCTSHRGREKLFGLLMDGCIPDARGYGTLHGAYRITLADAQEIGLIKGVRYVGMPRKPRSKPVEPVEAIQASGIPANDAGLPDMAVAA